MKMSLAVDKQVLNQRELKRGITVVPAGQQDRNDVRSLFGALHAFNADLDRRFALADGWPALLNQHLEREWATGASATLLAHHGEAPIGLVIVGGHTDSPMFQERHWAEIMALYVVPDERGCGVADGLTDAAIEWAAEHGYDRIQLYVTATNVHARRFYARSGFQPIQEIWCREVVALPVNPPSDDVCETAQLSGEQLIGPHEHQLADRHTS
jgi:GNAT superfamily N-acetyltransferase